MGSCFSGRRQTWESILSLFGDIDRGDITFRIGWTNTYFIFIVIVIAEAAAAAARGGFSVSVSSTISTGRGLFLFVVDMMVAQ